MIGAVPFPGETTAMGIDDIIAKYSRPELNAPPPRVVRFGRHVIDLERLVVSEDDRAPGVPAGKVRMHMADGTAVELEGAEAALWLTILEPLVSDR